MYQFPRLFEVLIADRSTRQTHVFNLVKARQGFLVQVPSIVTTAVQKARALSPNLPAFAIGVMAPYIAHHDVAVASENGFYQEAHLPNQCRGTFVFLDHGRRFTCFLASGKPTDTVRFQVHRKGSMTFGAQPGQDVLFALDEDVPNEGNHFFLIVEGFTERDGREKRRIYLVWGHLIDKVTLEAEYVHPLGEGDLGIAVPFTPNPDLPPIEDAMPLIDVEVEDE